jgi:hypothetical protein
MNIRIRKQASEKEFYMEFLRHTSMNMPKDRILHPKEIEVLAEFWNLSGDLVRNHRFSTSAKRYVREKFGYKNYSNLENYLYSLHDKGYIIKDSSGNWQISKKYNLPKGHKNIRIQYDYEVEVSG